MKIPKQIKVGGFIWTIEENDKVANEGQVFGSTHHHLQRIFLEPNESQQKKEHTFFHEMLHCIWWQAGLNERFKEHKNLEEEVISTLAHSLYQVLKDNKLIK